MGYNSFGWNFGEDDNLYFMLQPTSSSLSLGSSENNFKSSFFNIYRIPTSDRYSNFNANFQDKIKSVAGGTKSYYMGTYFSETPISFDVAFDELYYSFPGWADWEREIKTCLEKLNNNGLMNLVLSEEPWKRYLVSFSQPPSFTFLEFDDKDDPRQKIKKKGEGNFSFICPEPFARSTFSNYDELRLCFYPTIYSGDDSIINNYIKKYHIGYYKKISSNSYYFYNYGDLPVYPIFEIKCNYAGVICTKVQRFERGNSTSISQEMNYAFEGKEGQSYYINCKNNMITKKDSKEIINNIVTTTAPLIGTLSVTDPLAIPVDEIDETYTVVTVVEKDLDSSDPSPTIENLWCDFLYLR